MVRARNHKSGEQDQHKPIKEGEYAGHWAPGGQPVPTNPPWRRGRFRHPLSASPARCNAAESDRFVSGQDRALLIPGADARPLSGTSA